MNRFVPIIVFVFACISLVTCIYSLSLHIEKASVSFVDVGQGDAILIESGNGNRMLIDAGRGEETSKKIARMFPYGDKDIDVILATHFDADHIGGFQQVLSDYDISYALLSGAQGTTKTAQRFIDNLKKENAEILQGKEGVSVVLGSDVHIEILYPFLYSIPISHNDGSIIAKVYAGNKTYLLTGDASFKIEHMLVDHYGTELQSDVLKLGHHGSKSSSSERFLNMVSPEIAIISAGLGNQYGHPHVSVLERLKNALIPYVATYDMGTISL